jgi:predicted amidophosphoribosyltransferase
MTSDLSRIETRDFRLCSVCLAEARELDKFCRRCGVRLTKTLENDSDHFASSGHNTYQLAQGDYQSISGALVAAVATGISQSTAQLRSRLARWLLSALVSIPIWLLIVLLSPFDAYATARAISKQV